VHVCNYREHLDNEKTGGNECQIDEIIAAKHERRYTSLEAARGDGYDNCRHCLGASTRWRSSC
jgi:hypothetical protein